MSSALSADEIARDATWLAQAFEPSSGLVRFVKLDRAAYRAASFLDDRIFGQPQVSHAVTLDAVRTGLAPDARQDAAWIFHIGHVGSTLISRLLGELPGVLSAREPRILRDVAALPQAERGAVTGSVRTLLSRTFAPQELALVKATSFVSEIAAELVGSGRPALLVHARPAAYIASILAGENSLKEMHALAAVRAARMDQRVGPLPAARSSDAHLAAAAWACEITSLEAAARALPGPVMWLDFDRMLGDIAGHLERLCGFFGFAADRGTLERIAGGPLVRRYSKALEYEYSPQLRRDLLSEAWHNNRGAIADALGMLEEAGRRSELLGAALRRAEGES